MLQTIVWLLIVAIRNEMLEKMSMLLQQVCPFEYYVAFVVARMVVM